MAESRESDAVYDHQCSFCLDKGTNSEGVFFCKNCVKHICGACNTLHGSLFSNHDVLDRDSSQLWGTIKSDVDVDMCNVHREKEASMVCGSHDVVCCTVCIRAEHRKCDDVKAVSDLAEEIHTRQDYQNMTTTMSNLLSKLKLLKEKKQTDKSSIHEKAEEAHLAIDSMKEKLIEVIGELAQNTKQVVNEKLATLVDEIDKDIEASESLDGQSTELQTHLQANVSDNKSSAFRRFHRNQKTHEKVQQFLDTVNENESQLSFNPNPEIKRFLTSLKSLGDILSTTEEEHLNKEKTTEQNPTTNETRMKIDGHPVYTFSPKGSRQIPKEHEQEPKIKSVCVLRSGDVVVTSDQVRLFDTNFNLKDRCYILGKTLLPEHVCETDDNDIVVSASNCDKSHFLQFIKIDKQKLICTKTVKLDRRVDLMAFHGDKVYISAVLSSDLLVLTLNDLSIKTISGNYLKLCVSSCGDRIYTNEGTQLSTYDTDGNKLYTVTHPVMNNIKGIVQANNGYVLVVCDSAIIQFDREGKKKLTHQSFVETMGSIRHVDINRKTNTLLCLVGSRTLVTIELS